MNTPNLSNVFDANGLAAIKRLAHANDPQGIKAAAQQFEALFLQQVMQAMRDATPPDELFDSEQTRLYQSLLDQQMVQVMATKSGTGLAALIEKQLSRAATAPQTYPDGLPLQAPTLPPMSLNPRAAALSFPAPTGAAAVPAADAAANSSDAFIRRVWPYAQAAGRQTGIPAQFIIAQAALESGWGSAEPKLADGRPSFNLFGIKAGAGWSGAVAEATTTEVVGGLAQKRVERFRAYGSYAEAFNDYATLLLANPRYGAVLKQQDGAAFARELQRAGYATDPHYAAKLQRILGAASLQVATRA